MRFAAVVLAATVLVGCASTPSANPSTSPTPSGATDPTPTPTPTPTPEADADADADAVILRADGFEIVAESGTVLFAHAWADDAAPAVAELTDAFASEPTISEKPGDGSHFPDYTVYAWGGFEFSDAIDLQRPRDEYGFATTVFSSASAVNEVEITTESGIGVGSTFEEVIASGVEAEPPYNGRTSFLLEYSELGSAMAGSGDEEAGVLDFLGAPVAWGL
jgi:hypothetical protein